MLTDILGDDQAYFCIGRLVEIRTRVQLGSNGQGMVYGLLSIGM